MANINATEYANEIASPVIRNAPDVAHGRIRWRHFTYTNTAGGAASDTATLVRLPAGKRVRLIKPMSFVVCSAFGAARVLSVGYTAYVNTAGTTVSASTNTIADSIDISAAALKQMGTGTNGIGADTDILFDARDGIVLQGVVTGGTIPAGATLAGGFSYVVD